LWDEPAAARDGLANGGKRAPRERKESPMRTRTGISRDILIYTAVWTVLGLFSFAEWLASASSRTVHRPWPPVLGSTMLDYYTTGLATPVYVWLVRRFPIVAPRIGRTVLLYVAVMAACVVLKWLVDVRCRTPFSTAAGRLCSCSSTIRSVSCSRR
jgi:hypothetical protein